MITSKADYKEYYIADLQATGLNVKPNLIVYLKDKRYRFYKMLRKAEYYTNCGKEIPGGGIWGKLIRMRYHFLCEKYMWTIPINVFGRGLCIVHSGPIVVNGSVKVGEYARVHVGVNIGQAYAHGKAGAPVIGDRCYFGPGVKIFGPIEIGDNVAIGANAVVNQSFTEGNCTIAGVPARKISDYTSDRYILPQGSS